MMTQYPGAVVAQDQFSREQGRTGRHPPYTLDPPVVEGKAMEYIIHLPAAPEKQH